MQRLLQRETLDVFLL